jgi:hypothetical protein
MSHAPPIAKHLQKSAAPSRHIAYRRWRLRPAQPPFTAGRRRRPPRRCRSLRLSSRSAVDPGQPRAHARRGAGSRVAIASDEGTGSSVRSTHERHDGTQRAGRWRALPRTRAAHANGGAECDALHPLQPPAPWLGPNRGRRVLIGRAPGRRPAPGEAVVGDGGLAAGQACTLPPAVAYCRTAVNMPALWTAADPCPQSLGQRFALPTCSPRRLRGSLRDRQTGSLTSFSAIAECSDPSLDDRLVPEHGRFSSFTRSAAP